MPTLEPLLDTPEIHTLVLQRIASCKEQFRRYHSNETREESLSCPGNFLYLIGLDDITYSYVVKAFDTQTTLVTRQYLFGVIRESAERPDGALKHDAAVADDTK